MEITQYPKPRKPWRNRKYVAFVATKPCLWCGRQSWSPHHDREIGPCGLNRRPSDAYVLPICLECHDHIHNADAESKEMAKRVGREDRMMAMIDQLDEWIQRRGL